jgi:hypothetical protein
MTTFKFFNDGTRVLKVDVLETGLMFNDSDYILKSMISGISINTNESEKVLDIHMKNTSDRKRIVAYSKVDLTDQWEKMFAALVVWL